MMSCSFMQTSLEEARSYGVNLGEEGEQEV
jgi:hypothetical protein